MYITAIQGKTFCFLNINNLQQSISNFQPIPVTAYVKIDALDVVVWMKDVSTPHIEMLLSSVTHMSLHFEENKILEGNVISTGPVQENMLNSQSLEKLGESEKYIPLASKN